MPRVALIHDFLLDLRGAERVFAAICDAYPDGRRLHRRLRRGGHRGAIRRALAAGVVPAAAAADRAHVPAAAAVLPAAIESLDLRGYDIVVSSSSAWAHGVLVDPGAVHVCYCHNPFRYAWSEREATLAARNPLTRPAAARAALALAPVGLDRRPARRRLRRELGDHRRADPALLRARVDGPAPAGRALALLARAGRRALPGAGRADGAQAHRRRDPGLQRARAAAGGRGGRARVAAAAAPGRPDGAADRPALRRRGRRPAAHARRRSSSPPRRSSGSPRSSRWPPGGR